MRWSVPPKYLFRFNQAHYLTRRELGVCYGMCRIILEHVGWVPQATDLKKAFDGIQGKINTDLFIDRSRTAQKKRRQTGRPVVPLPLKERIFYIGGCNISLAYGYCTYYSLSSYVTPSAWMADHAVLLVGIEGGTIILDPNWGCAAWDGLDIRLLKRRTIEELVGGGYNSGSGPIYLAEVEK